MPSRAELAAQETKDMLQGAGALLSGDHFVYVSGDHGSGWVDKDVIFIDLQHTRRLGQLLAEAVADAGAEVLCGPAIGGLIVAQWTAFELGLPAVFAEHEVIHSQAELRGRFGLHRGYDRLVSGKRVLVVDDIINTGQSARQTVEAVRACGGKVTTVAALVHRGNVDAAGLGVERYTYLVEHDIPGWPGDTCPLCKQGVPVNTRYAHGQDYLNAQRK